MRLKEISGMDENMSLSETLGWDCIWQIEKDIFLLYHELSRYKAIVCDLTYLSVFPLPYWEFLIQDLPALSVDEENLVIQGCLMMILAMCWEIIDGSGSYLSDHLERVRECVTLLRTDVADTLQLKSVVLQAMDVAQKYTEKDESVEAAACWANSVFVGGYYSRRVQ